MADISDRQDRIVRMVEIQALNQLMRPDEAATKLDQASDLLSGDTRVAVLRAMTLSQQNQRDASNDLIDQSLPDQDPRSAVVALAVRIANDIPLEKETQARTSFEDALAMAKLWGLVDLEEELVRLNAKLVSPPELAIERMRDHLATPPSTEVGRARLIHNLGVQEMLVSDGQEGGERLWKAREVFARHGLSFAAYSAVSLAVAEVARTSRPSDGIAGGCPMPLPGAIRPFWRIEQLGLLFSHCGQCRKGIGGAGTGRHSSDAIVYSTY